MTLLYVFLSLYRYAANFFCYTFSSFFFTSACACNIKCLPAMPYPCALCLCLYSHSALLALNDIYRRFHYLCLHCLLRLPLPVPGKMEERDLRAGVWEDMICSILFSWICLPSAYCGRLRFLRGLAVGAAACLPAPLLTAALFSFYIATFCAISDLGSLLRFTGVCYTAMRVLFAYCCKSTLRGLYTLPAMVTLPACFAYYARARRRMARIQRAWTLHLFLRARTHCRRLSLQFAPRFHCLARTTTTGLLNVRSGT